MSSKEKVPAEIHLPADQPRGDRAKVEKASKVGHPGLSESEVNQVVYKILSDEMKRREELLKNLQNDQVKDVQNDILHILKLVIEDIHVETEAQKLHTSSKLHSTSKN